MQTFTKLKGGCSSVFRSQLRRNMLVGCCLTAVSAAVMAVSYAIYLRRLGYEQYGMWLILSTVVAFSQIGNLGISQAVTKKVAELWVTRNVSEVKAYVSAACGLVLLTGFAVVTVVIALRYQVASLLHLSVTNTAVVVDLLPLVAVFSVYLFVVDISNATLNGLGRLDLCSACQTAAQVFALGFSLIFLALGGGLRALLLGNLAGYATAHLISSLCSTYITKHFLLGLRGVRLRHAGGLMNIGGWMFGSALMNLLLTPINRGLLARFGGVGLIPMYDIPFNSCMRMRSLFESPQRALVAEVSSLAASDGTQANQRIRQLHARAFRLVLGAAPVFLLVALCADPVLRIWLGKRFDPAMTTCFRGMALGVLASAFGVPAYYVLLGLGQVASIFKANAAQALTNITIAAVIIIFAHSLSALNLVVSASLGLAAGGAVLMWQQRQNQKPLTSFAS